MNLAVFLSMAALSHAYSASARTYLAAVMLRHIKGTPQLFIITTMLKHDHTYSTDSLSILDTIKQPRGGDPLTLTDYMS